MKPPTSTSAVSYFTTKRDEKAHISEYWDYLLKGPTSNPVSMASTHSPTFWPRSCSKKRLRRYIRDFAFGVVVFERQLTRL